VFIELSVGAVIVLKSRDAKGMEKNFLLKSGCGHGT
jgi:hypothetical protein